MFPVVGGIPVLRHRPAAVIAAAQAALERTSSQVEQARDELATKSATATMRPALARRAHAMLEGQEANVNLMRSYMAPVAEYLRSHNALEPGALDWIAADTRGWEPQVMLPYFYQDWCRGREFGRARSVIVDALRHYCPNVESLVVVGSGACGLVHAGAAHFGTVYGTDFSLPTLLIARGLLSGDSPVVHMAAAGWSAVKITGVRPKNGDIRLAVAHAASLPFADASVSAVVTQYLMDIVGNPLAVAGEISRVLRPGGVWVNFSNPFNVPTEPSGFGAATIDELPALLEPFGFDVRHRERRRFTLLDVSGLDPHATAHRQEVHFVVACRSSRPDVCSRDIAASAHYMEAGHVAGDENCWTAIPVTMPGRDLRLVRIRALASETTQELVQIGVGTGVPVPPQVLELVDALFRYIDGKRSAQDIFGSLISDGVQVNAEEFCELLGFLSRHYGVIDLVSTRTSRAGRGRNERLEASASG